MEVRKDVKEALRNYTRGPTYLRELVQGAPRIDLDGNVVSYVTIQEAEFARKDLHAVLIHRARFAHRFQAQPQP